MEFLVYTEMFLEWQRVESRLRTCSKQQEQDLSIFLKFNSILLLPAE